MAFRTQFDHVKPVVSNPGTAVVPVFSSRYDASGELEIYESGTHDLYSDIQSHADSCDINIILTRYANGELDVLSQRQGMFGDFSGLPDNVPDMLNYIENCRSFFEHLPVEIKDKFGNSFEKFASSVSPEDFVHYAKNEESEVVENVPEQ